MKRQLQYLIGSIPVIPLLPLLYAQGKKIRSTVPVLPEAEGVTGLAEAPSTRSIQLLTIGESTDLGFRFLFFFGD